MKLQIFFKKKSMSLPLIFGNLDNGSHDNPSVIKESVHYFFKYVSGNILQRLPDFLMSTSRGKG